MWKRFIFSCYTADMTRAQKEYVIAIGIFVILLGFLAVAVLTARENVRDDLRKADITNLKRAAEMYYNQHNFFPPGALGCMSSHDLAVLLDEGHIDALPHDVRENRDHAYKYCVTNLQENQAQGFFLEAELEGNSPDVIDFDEDETRKFHYRILHENGKILYRVCGGTETQCTPVES